MPIIRSAKKALRSSRRKKVVNDRRTKAMKEAIKGVEKLVKNQDVKKAKESLSGAYSAIDKALKAGVLKKNTAARKKSRLSRITK